jgi:hypothetical protein
MKRIIISDVLSADLKSRSNVHTLYKYIENMNPDEVIFDFSNVKFATRSFLDEFYNVFLKTHRFKTENVPSDIKLILDIVSRTQEDSKKIVHQNNLKSFDTVDDFCNYMTSIAF